MPCSKKPSVSNTDVLMLFSLSMLCTRVFGNSSTLSRKTLEARRLSERMPHCKTTFSHLSMIMCLLLLCEAKFCIKQTDNYLSYKVTLGQTEKCCHQVLFQFSSVQSLSRVRLSATPRITARQASLFITNSRNSLRLKSTESVMPSSHLILGRPLLLPPPTLPSIRVLSSESTRRMRWPKYCSFSFSISPSNEHPGSISLRMDWLDLLAVQGTLKSLLQHHSSKASILRRSAFFTVQLSHPYMTTGKTIALTRRTLVGKVMPLLFNMLSRLVITFLPRSKHLLISWLQSASAVILEPPKIKSDTVSTVFPSISHEVMGPDAMIFVF
ncbi:uncharacterized protein LOC129557952 [Moschus berezovskii]|nr:uncharacterized protein LOC129557952 [Moschus berezovskii]